MKPSTVLKTTLLCTLLFLSSGGLYAQFSKNSDLILYCEDGSVYIGWLVDETRSDFQVEILEGDTITVAKDLVRKVRRSTDYMIYKKKGKTHRVTGFFLGLQVGYNTFSTNPEGPEFLRSANLLFGYRLNKRWTVAASIDATVNEVLLTGTWGSTAHLSPSIHTRYYLTDKRIRPFVYNQVGCGFEVGGGNGSDNLGIGFTMQNGIGLHFASRRRTRLTLSLGHYLQRIKGSSVFFDQFDHEVRLDYRYWISKGIFKIGLEFN